MQVRLSSIAVQRTLDNKKQDFSELKFVTELGRSLLQTVHPKKVAECVATAVQRQTRAVACAFIVELGQVGLILCAFDADGDDVSQYVNKRRFRKRLGILPPQISAWSEDRSEFLLDRKEHNFEYLSPIHTDGKVTGVLVAAFSEKKACKESDRRVIDAAAQMAALSVNLTSHFEATMGASISTAKEENRKFTETVLDALPVSLYVIDREYRIVTWNQHRELGNQGLQRDAVIGRSVFDVLTKQPHKQLKEEFDRVFETGKIETTEQRTADENGMTRHWLISKVPMVNKRSGEITHVISVGEEITQRVEAIHAVARAEKLAAVGRLAAGVVHEINNPLATISACAEALESRVSEGAFGESSETDDLREYLGLIRSETFRCKSITNGLLDFSRPRSGNRIPLDVMETIRSSVKLISHQTRKKNVEIRVEGGKNLPPVKVDEGQMQQAFIALAANAVDAMSNGGTLIFNAFANRGRVVVEVSDTGVGIPADDLPKIFEPFFTTKGIGKGTGLGLAVCYGIVTEHGGRLSVRSTPGVGTTFSISIPLAAN